MTYVDPVLEILNALKGSITPPRVNLDRSSTYPDPIISEGRLLGTYYDSYVHDHLHEITVQGQTYRLMVSEYLAPNNSVPPRVDALLIGSTRHPALQVPGE